MHPSPSGEETVAGESGPVGRLSCTGALCALALALLLEAAASLYMHVYYTNCITRDQALYSHLRTALGVFTLACFISPFLAVRALERSRRFSAPGSAAVFAVAVLALLVFVFRGSQAYVILLTILDGHYYSL
jgi:hypothetical protein